MVKLYIDGAARGNPGESGAGIAIYDQSDALIDTIREYLGPSLTNNRAEYSALIIGLEAAHRYGDQAEVFSDSQLLVQQMNGVYQVKHPDLKPLYEQAKSLLKKYRAVRFHHVRRELNKVADQLANEAIDQREA